MTQGALTAIDPRPGWSWEPLGYLAPRVAEDGHGDLEPLSVYLGAGVVRRADREDNHNVLGADMDKYLRVLPGDLVFNKLRTWQGGLGASKYEGIVSPAYYILRPGPRLEPRFAHYLLVSTPYLAELTRLSKFMPPSQFDMPWEELKRLPIALPPVEEQRRIADFLDDQVTRIDSLAEVRRDQSLLVTSRETARLEQILWNDDAGIQLRRLGTRVTTGPFGTSFAASEYVTGGIPMINPTHIHDGTIEPDDDHTVTRDVAHRLMRHQLRAGDVISGRKGDLGRSALVRDGQDGWVCGSDSIAIHPMARVLDPEFLSLVLHLPRVRADLVSQSAAATMPSLNEGMLLSLEVPDVDLLEQRRRSCVANDVRTDAAETRRELQEAVDLLEERKRSLITAAVTGELDVTTAKPIGMGKWVPNIGANAEAAAGNRTLSSVGGMR